MPESPSPIGPCAPATSFHEVSVPAVRSAMASPTRLVARLYTTANARRGTVARRRTASLGGSSSAMKWKRTPAGAWPDARMMRTASRISDAVSGASGGGAATDGRQTASAASQNRTRCPVALPQVADPKGPPIAKPDTVSGFTLQRFFRPPLQNFLHLRHKLVGQRPVDEAMVEAQREVADGPDGDRVID